MQPAFKCIGSMWPCGHAACFASRMETKALDSNTFAVIFSTGEDPVAGLTRFAQERAIGASSFTAIGAFSAAELGYFDWEKKDYERIPVREQVEVLSLIGDIAFEGDKPKIHAHV